MTSLLFPARNSTESSSPSRSSFSQVWIYPNQRHGFALVSLGKLGAWYLLMIISFVLVSLVHRPVLLRKVRQAAIAG